MAVADGEILDVGPAAEVLRRHVGAVQTDLGAVILAPGLVDVHCHLEWALAGGVAHGPGFGAWLGRFLAVMRGQPPEHHDVAAAHGALMALRSGTTSLCDNGPLGAGVRACHAAGLRATVCVEAFGDDPQRAEAAAAAVRALEAEATGHVRVGVSPHAPYSVGPGLWGAMAAHPELVGRAWSTHIAESPDECRALRSGDGPLADTLRRWGGAPAVWDGPPDAAPVARLAAAGALRAGMVAAHCVQLDARDAATLAAADVRVAHCPSSNAHIGVGVMPLALLWDAGVAVGLGSDSPGSGGAFDGRAAARACALVHARAGAVLTPERMVRMATLDGARVLGLDSRVGTLEPGKRADMVAVRPAAGAVGPGDPHELFLRADAAVCRVWVDGVARLRDGAAVDLDEAAISRRADEVLATLC
ncbi:MAG: amidohydrolase family protein [Thermoleophilia bacterium]